MTKRNMVKNRSTKNHETAFYSLFARTEQPVWRLHVTRRKNNLSCAQEAASSVVHHSLQEPPMAAHWSDYGSKHSGSSHYLTTLYKMVALKEAYCCLLQAPTGSIGIAPCQPHFLTPMATPSYEAAHCWFPTERHAVLRPVSGVGRP